jgi:outer membrane lipoprotein-sorting protein
MGKGLALLTGVWLAWHPGPLAGALPATPGAPAWDEVVESYGRVRDYTCLYTKQERAISNGELQTIRLAFRRPLDVRLEWLNDRGDVDQIAVYRDGANNGRLVAKRSGMLGSLVGTQQLDPRDPRALEDSRHPITEVGLGHIIGGIAKALRDGLLTRGPILEETLDGGGVYRSEFSAATATPILGVPAVRKAVIWVDRELRLPVKVELSDAAGSMIERHRFKDLRLNVGLADATFAL